ncbi:hypothetical protein D5R40_33775 [Okeania hirsuta]|uniref:Uncharacterized protein n=1 Tax=Okeania hirsuta TaxID=1458930 RepID=A0A3N6QNA0_9CYAN|nr:hypothetical protein D5R40_33775 [Okeania hirsuta]
MRGILKRAKFRAKADKQSQSDFNAGDGTEEINAYPCEQSETGFLLPGNMGIQQASDSINYLHNDYPQ